MTTTTQTAAANVSPALERAMTAVLVRHIRASSHGFASVFAVGISALVDKVAAKGAR